MKLFYFLSRLPQNGSRRLQIMATTSFRMGAARVLAWQWRQIHSTVSNHKSWNTGKVNHIAIACPDLDKAAWLYRDVLKAKVSEKQTMPEQGVTIVFVELGDTKIELLHPLGEKSPIANFLEKNKSGGLHHICLEVDNISAAMENIKSQKIRTISESPSIGAHGKPVIFLNPKDCNGVLIELEEV